MLYSLFLSLLCSPSIAGDYSRNQLHMFYNFFTASNVRLYFPFCAVFFTFTVGSHSIPLSSPIPICGRSQALPTTAEDQTFSPEWLQNASGLAEQGESGSGRGDVSEWRTG